MANILDATRWFGRPKKGDQATAKDAWHDDLREIYKRCIDSEALYSEARNDVPPNEQSAGAFIREAHYQRRRMVAEMSGLMAGLGVGIDPQRTTVGKLRKEWMAFASAVDQAKPLAVIEALIGGDKRLLSGYDAMEKHQNLPRRVQLTLEAQRRLVQQSLSRMQGFINLGGGS
ncbi:MAG: DUF2383 domain-containing protein [Deltaproteobacteria bacterium]|nr:DUF2383 domain-containing protein [Deltaproteobacteria bacterium]